MTVMPGMVDAHCHISYGNIQSFEELDLYTPVEFRSIRAAYNAKKILRAGVTAFCDPDQLGTSRWPSATPLIAVWWRPTYGIGRPLHQHL